MPHPATGEVSEIDRLRTEPVSEECTMRAYDNYSRWFYRKESPNLFAQIQNRLSAWVFAAGIAPRLVSALGVGGGAASL